VGQTLVHVALPETNRSVSVRFVFFFTQVICVLALAVLLLLAIH
jgi:hypothetical protein